MTPPPRPAPSMWWGMWPRRRFPAWALFLVVFGIWWLGGELGYWRFEGRYVWPLLLVTIGLSVLVSWAMRR